MISRRALLVGSAALAGAGAGLAAYVARGNMGISPTFLWGATEELFIYNGASSSQELIVSNQLANIAHSQPESWCFVLGVTLTEIVALNGNNPWEVWFQLNLGLGRSTISLPRFGVCSFPDDVNTLSSLHQTRFFQRVVYAPGPNPDPTAEPNIIDRVTAQAIQCAGVGNRLILGSFRLQMSAFFAPVSIGGGLR